MSKSKIPALASRISASSSKSKSRYQNQQPSLPKSENTTKSSNLLNYGFVGEKSGLSSTGSREISRSSEKIEKSEKLVKKNVIRSAKEDVVAPPRNEVTAAADSQSNNVEKESKIPTPAHLDLSQTQLNALSYSLSELADKISPSKNDPSDESEWEMLGRVETGNSRSNSLSRSKKPTEDTANASHSKSPYSRNNDAKPHLSKQKSFQSKTKLFMSKESEGDENSNIDKNVDNHEVEKDEVLLKGNSPHQESIESGYNSSWSASSVSWSEGVRNGTDVDTDVDVDLNDETLKEERNVEVGIGLKKNVNYEMALQKKISDVEQRINSLISGAGSSDVVSGVTETKSNQNQKTDINEMSAVESSTDREITTEIKDAEQLTNGIGEDPTDTEKIAQEDTDLNQSVNLKYSQSLETFPKENGEMKKSPFHILKVQKISMDDSNLPQKPKRPGLVRRRTTLVTFRQPRQTSAFKEVDDSGVLEIDEAGFVQCLTDVRAMKTMLLKLKRELQEAEVQSPLARKTNAHRSTTNLAGVTGLNEPPEVGERRHTYDSSEVHEKLRRIRTASLSRRKCSVCVESTPEDPSAQSTEVKDESSNSEEAQTPDSEMKKIKEELDDLRGKMKSIKQERDTLFMDKEEIEHELETKNHTIKMLQKQLESQENSEEMTYLQRQVTSLTQQVRQQHQKITELRYRATSPSNTPGSVSLTNFSTKKDSVKLDIKNRLRDAFVRHLEESSKSHLLLSKHIEKAEFTICEAQKGLKSLCITPTSQNSSRERLTEDGNSSGKKRPLSSVFASPRTSPRTSSEDIRRHSWTTNSIDKIIKTWKETTQSIENLSSPSSNQSKKNSKLPLPGSSPHLAYL